jgi:hypothetical protein
MGFSAVDDNKIDLVAVFSLQGFGGSDPLPERRSGE